MRHAPSPAHVAPAEAPSTSGALALQVGVVVIAGLYFAREVLIPITLAVLLSFLLEPVVAWLRRVHVPRVLAVLLAVAMALGVILALGGLIGTQVASLARDVPRYAATAQQKVEAVQSFAVTRLSTVIRGVSRQVERVSSGEAPTAPGFADRLDAGRTDRGRVAEAGEQRQDRQQWNRLMRHPERARSR